MHIEDKWSDSELLRLAATACDYHWNWEVEKERYALGIRGLWIPGVSTFWNPIEDSGQALDLTARLNLNISYREGVASVGRLSEWVAGKPYCAANEAATRLAIVKAAAVIGGEKNRPDSKLYAAAHRKADAQAMTIQRMASLVKRVVGDHHAPQDCFSSGPLTGTAEDDMCPACAALRFLEFVG